MRDQHKIAGVVLKNKELLLWIVSSVSLLFFFVTLCFIPKTSEMASFLRGTAFLLTLCMPALFYLRSIPVLQEKDEERTTAFVFWRFLLFAVGSLLFGAFLAELIGVRTEKSLLFSLFAFPSSFSMISLASLLAFAFSLTFLPYALLSKHLLKQGSIFGAVLAPACLFTSLFFSYKAMPLLFFYGVVLSLQLWQSKSYLSLPICTACLFFGGYSVSVGFFHAELFSFFPRPLFILLLCVVSLACFFCAFHYKDIKKAWQYRKPSKYMRAVCLLFSLAFLLLSLLFSLIA